MRSRLGLAAAGLLLVLPVLGFALLVHRPRLDVVWEHHPSQFWLVVAVAATSAVLAYATGVTATRRGDARVVLVSLTFLVSAGFLGLHALATPGVLLDRSNTGFAVATPVGLALGSAFSVWSSVDLSNAHAEAVLRHARSMRWAILGAMAVWATWSLAELPPLDARPAERASGIFLGLAVPAVVLYAVAGWRYLSLGGLRRSPVLLGMAAAFALLGEAMVAIAFARNWHASWWEWHVLMAAAFGLVAPAANRQWHEERFADLYLDSTTSGEREISVLMADLEGFTTFSQARRPDEVTAMLNAHLGAAIPAVVAHGGDVDRIVGDALVATFNRRGDQPDHARRAAAAALDLQRATAKVADDHAGWPRFRVGVNTGPVAMSVLGTSGGRTHTVIGDTVNVAARLESSAPVGAVVIGAATAAQVPDARTAPLGPIDLRGRTATEDAYLLLGMPERAGS